MMSLLCRAAGEGEECGEEKHKAEEGVPVPDPGDNVYVLPAADRNGMFRVFRVLKKDVPVVELLW